jgi:hypothetical protein
MRALGVGAFALCVFALVGTTTHMERAQAQLHDGAAVSVPKTWDDAAMATLEVPLANPIGSPKHVSADYYNKIPVRPIYKQYPVYAPGHEPPGYMDWLKQQEPQIIWDNAGHRPPLQTHADWVKAVEVVFDAIIYYTNHRVVDADEVRNAAWYQKPARPLHKTEPCRSRGGSYAKRVMLNSAILPAGCATPV